MSTGTPGIGPFSSLAPDITEDLKQLKRSWFWFVLLGVALIILGVVAIGYSTLFTIASVEVFGIFLIVGAAFCIGGSFFTGSWGGFFLTLLTGVLQLVMGLISVLHPAELAIVYTLFMAVFFMVGGLFRIVGSLARRFRGRGWVLVNGIITLILGVMIWQQMPFSGFWVIGTFLGIDLIFNGWSYVLLGLGVRKVAV
jgi:uncharacterized membrane protein HdeD (DUF308 family)